MSTTEVKFLAAAALLAFSSNALAEVRYVDVNSTNSTPPYTNWSTAATSIQAAVIAGVTTFTKVSLARRFTRSLYDHC